MYKTLNVFSLESSLTYGTKKGSFGFPDKPCELLALQHFSFTLNKVQKLALNIVTGCEGREKEGIFARHDKQEGSNCVEEGDGRRS